MKNELKIIVQGPPASGKSRIAYLIAEVLLKEGFNVDHKVSIDYKDADHRTRYCENNKAQALDGIKSMSDITIEEVQSKRKCATHQ